MGGGGVGWGVGVGGGGGGVAGGWDGRWVGGWWGRRGWVGSGEWGEKVGSVEGVRCLGSRAGVIMRTLEMSRAPPWMTSAPPHPDMDGLYCAETPAVPSNRHGKKTSINRPSQAPKGAHASIHPETISGWIVSASIDMGKKHTFQ